MSNHSLGLDEALTTYLRNRGVRESNEARELREVTLAENEWSRMQISPEQGAFLSLMVRLTGAKRIVEIGTFTGYSALWMAEALPADGKIEACDISEEWTSFGRAYWEKAGVSEKIQTHIAPALETLEAWIESENPPVFDMAFIDADKENYEGYFEACLKLVRPGGLIAVDNVLWGGSVLDEEKDESTTAIVQFNESRTHDDRVHLAMTPIGDGLTLCIVK